MTGPGPAETGGGAALRVVVYLGTRTCPQTLEASLRDHPEAVRVLVPSDPGLLGELDRSAPLEAGFEAVAGILAERALEVAGEVVRARDAAYAGVFDAEPPDPEDQVSTQIVDALDQALGELGEAEAVYVARDALDVLEGAGLDPREVLEDQALDLVAV